MTAYEMRISDWSSYVCSSDLGSAAPRPDQGPHRPRVHCPGRPPEGQLLRFGHAPDPGGQRHRGRCALAGHHPLGKADGAGGGEGDPGLRPRSEEHTSELQSLMRTSYAVFCLKKKKKTNTKT